MSFFREPDAEPIAGYRLIEPLGSGGFGEVWKCEAPGGLFKAIKFVFGNLNSLDVEGARAEQELHALQRVKEVRHPFVLSMDRIEVVEGELAIVMELADKSLHDLYVECQNAGLIGIPRDDLLRYIRDAAEALDHMNEKHNLQHLDIKPRNLFLISDRVKVADFGLVKHLERASGSGLLGAVTPLYAPPETLNGKLSERSDQYSLAIVYYELLTGARPFNGKNPRQLAQQHLQEEPELRALPEAERPIVGRALAKDPVRRFPNCLAFVRALYTARTAPRPEPSVPEALIEENGRRPKSLAETMEDFQLEHLVSDEQAEVLAAAMSGSEEVSQLGITVAQPQTGALRPTLILGVGGFGRRALLELRCRFLDRFGDLGKIPVVRFLYVDSDVDATRAALRGAPEVAFKPHEVHHLPLQPVSHYRRRHLDHLSDWLPREKLYALPRSLKTQGSRALGRLAFTDNYLRLLARLRRELQQAAHPDNLYQTVTQTGLAIRDHVPRVYVIAAAGGGNSGSIVDIGYTLRRLLQQLRQADSPVAAMVLCGAPEDPATPKTEQANIYATLTELNHFADAAVPFTAQYGTDGPRIIEHGSMYDAIYLLTQSNRTPEARRDVIAHVGSYLFHELTTPLGLKLDRSRQSPRPPDASAFRSLGTYAVWFPRGLLLRLAAREGCKRLFEDWGALGAPTAVDEVEAACARVLADPELRPEALAAQLEEVVSKRMNGAPREVLAGLLASLEEQALQSMALDDPGNWARQAVTRVKEWCGIGLSSGRETGEWRKSRLNRALEESIRQVAEEWTKKLTEAAFGLMEHPGRRVAAAEDALTRFMQFCDERAAAQAAIIDQQAGRAQEAEKRLEEALAHCVAGAGGFSLFGGRTRRLLRVFLDHLSAFARQCLAEDLTSAVRQFMVCLHGKLKDRMQDLAFCRQRLRNLQDAIEAPDVNAAEATETPYALDASPSPAPILSTESFWEAIRQSATTRVVLPEDAHDLERGALRLLRTLGPEQWTQLDQTLQEQVLGPLGGLHHACASSSDLVRSLASPLIESAADCLGGHLPITDVAQVLMNVNLTASNAESNGSDGTADSATLKERTEAFYASAAPLIAGEKGVQEHAFLLTPASDAGKAYGKVAQEAFSDLQVVRVPGSADLMFCREQKALRLEDLERSLQACRVAYEETSTVPNASPHARFDVSDWLPLAP